MGSFAWGAGLGFAVAIEALVASGLVAGVLDITTTELADEVVGGVLSAGPMLTASLSFDHRFIDGAEAVRFINDLADLFEHPERALG